MRVLPLNTERQQNIPENRLKFGSKCKMLIAIFATFPWKAWLTVQQRRRVALAKSRPADECFRGSI
jgi:hypothetical protein